jgi:Fur family peroxide stress response transcriptional regulator
MDNIDDIVDTASKHFDGEIDGHVTYFYGTCGSCRKSNLS